MKSFSVLYIQASGMIMKKACRICVPTGRLFVRKSRKNTFEITIARQSLLLKQSRVCVSIQ